MDTLPLPPRPDLAQYGKRAKDLVKVAGSTEPDAVRAWAREWLETLARLRGVDATPFVEASFNRAVAAIEERVREIAPRRFALADAQFLIARAHGFGSWGAFARHVERLVRDSEPFESGADAVVAGDLAALEALLRGNLDLVRARSERTHRATLLHYVAANGVEDFRQLTPPNAVAVATTLLGAGAEVDALANTYGGGNAQTTMNLLVSSTHPAEAGLQPALVETLLDFGASVNGVDHDGSPLMTALAFGYVEAAETLARRGARVDNVIAAAALGRVDLVGDMLAGDGSVNPSLVNLYWLGLSSDPESHLGRAFVWACAYGRTAVVELLLAHGVDPTVSDNHGMTGLDWARANEHADIVKLLTGVVADGRKLGTVAAVVISAAVLPVLGGNGAAAPRADQRPLYIQADRLFNGRTLVSGRVAVAVRKGRIVAAGRVRIPRGARVVRFPGGTILPGIIDLHVHASPPVLLRDGVTTTRNLGRPEAALRPPFAIRGYPREVSAGPVITVPGGYPTGRHPGIAAPVKSVQEATAKVNALVAKGAAVIKIALLAEVAGRPLPVLSVDQVRAIVAAAHRHRRLVTAHAVEGKGVELALAGGIDELAHMPCVAVTRDQITTIAQRGLTIVGTLHGARIFFRRECPDLLSNARAFVQAGGRLLYGTDIPQVAAALDIDELGLMQQLGMTPTQVLTAATAEAGKQLGMAPLGTLVRGAPADLLVVRGDPTRSLRALRRPLFVMARGQRGR